MIDPYPRSMLDELRRSGITPKDARRICLQHLGDHEVRDLLGGKDHGFGRTKQQVPEAYRIPYTDIDGRATKYFRLRFLGPLLDKKGKAIRYWQPPGSAPRLYYPRLGALNWRKLASDSSIPLYITEGEKKAEALAKLGLPALGLGGVWNWFERDGNDDKSRPLDEINLFNWRGRTVSIVFDSDSRHKTSVQRALGALATELVRRGALPANVQLPVLKGNDKTGVDDFLVHHGAGAKAKKAFLALPKEALIVPTGNTFAEAANKEHPPVEWIAKNFLPTGLTVLAGSPKIGKSWLALQLSVAVATGTKALGTYATVRGGVLHLALEDTERRFQDRLHKVLDGQAPPANATVQYAWPRVENGGLAGLRSWLDQHRDTRLVVIDTLALMRPRSRGQGNSYYEDYDAIRDLKQIADDYGLAVIAIHHLRKAAANDPLDQVSGTTGNTGAADTILVLKRQRALDEGTLYITGRDTVEQELALRFDPSDAVWRVLGNARDHRISQERQQIRDALVALGHPATPSEVAAAIDKERNSVKRLMLRMAHQGELRGAGEGRYEITGETGLSKGKGK